MNCTGKYVHYYSVCKRKLWLFANGITMEHTSDLVAEGTLIHEHSYPQRSAKYEEISLEGIRVDYYDPKEKVIHEVKKSMKMEEADEWQLKYYIYNGVGYYADCTNGRVSVETEKDNMQEMQLF